MTRPRQAECHPDRPHNSRGLCRPCYDSARHRRLLGHYRRTQPDRSIVERAAELRAELEAAAAYSGEPVSWRTVAEKLGVKYATLTRAQERARAQQRREQAQAEADARDLLAEDPFLFLDEGEEAA